MGLDRSRSRKAVSKETRNLEVRKTRQDAMKRPLLPSPTGSGAGAPVAEDALEAAAADGATHAARMQHYHFHEAVAKKKALLS